MICYREVLFKTGLAVFVIRYSIAMTGADPGFQVRGRGALKKIAPSGGRRENYWGISCEKSLGMK